MDSTTGGNNEQSEVVSGNYEVAVHCTNCEYSQALMIERGTVVADVLCPNCGCKTLNPDTRYWKKITTRKNEPNQTNEQ